MCLTCAYMYLSCQLLGLFWLERHKFGGGEHVISDARVSWFDARDVCHQDGATLAIIDSTQEDVYLREQFPSIEST